MKARYIVFEGIDGSGKGTMIGFLCDWLIKNYYTPIRLVEPSYGKYGLEIRQFLKEKNEPPRDRQLTLFTLDREDHVTDKIFPALQFVRNHRKFVIVQDRFYFSTCAYQAHTDEEVIKFLREQQLIAPKPDMVIYLDIPVETALERISKSRDSKSVYENIEKLKRVDRNYRLIVEEGSENVFWIDADLSPDAVFHNVLTVVKPEL